VMLDMASQRRATGFGVRRYTGFGIRRYFESAMRHWLVLGQQRAR